MTLIEREDILPGESVLNSYMRGLDALVSHDNGLTWNLDRQITLDEFNYYNPALARTVRLVTGRRAGT